jgi:hypothetical protein
MFKNLLKKIADKMGYVILKKSLPADVLREKEFVDILEKCQEYTMCASDKSFGLYKAVEYLSRTRTQGDFVECGVWKGGQSMLMAYALLKGRDTERRLWLYDTYAGMSEPTKYDTPAHPKEPALEKWTKHNKGDHNEWCYAPLDEVKDNVYSTKYPKEKFIFVQGKVEDTIPAHIPEKIALLRLDTDWYESTRHELEHLFPLLVKGGVLLIDDYGSWEGSRRAVDEYLQKHNVKILLSRVGESRLGVKVE